MPTCCTNRATFFYAPMTNIECPNRATTRMRTQDKCFGWRKLQPLHSLRLPPLRKSKQDSRLDFFLYRRSSMESHGYEILNRSFVIKAKIDEAGLWKRHLCVDKCVFVCCQVQLRIDIPMYIFTHMHRENVGQIALLFVSVYIYDTAA